MRHRPVLLSVLGLVAALLAVAVAPAQAADRDCGSFGDQRQAQAFFVAVGGPRSDPHRLDADSDGRACESLPCPCPTNTGGGTGGADATLRQRARVVRVVDGDTVEVRMRSSGAAASVRLVGIDTPEVYGGTECGGPGASRALKRALPRGTAVRLVSDPSQDLGDRYGRMLRYVHKVGSGRDIGYRQVRRGWATVYVHDGNAFRRVAAYRDAQRHARSHRLGIWGSC